MVNLKTKSSKHTKTAFNWRCAATEDDYLDIDRHITCYVNLWLYSMVACDEKRLRCDKIQQNIAVPQVFSWMFCSFSSSLSIEKTISKSCWSEDWGQLRLFTPTFDICENSPRFLKVTIWLTARLRQTYPALVEIHIIWQFHSIFNPIYEWSGSW